MQYDYKWQTEAKVEGYVKNYSTANKLALTQVPIITQIYLKDVSLSLRKTFNS